MLSRQIAVMDISKDTLVSGLYGLDRGGDCGCGRKMNC
jgi:hypothetical protein